MFASKDARRVSHRGVHPRVMLGEQYIEPCIPKGDRAAHTQPRIREQRAKVRTFEIVASSIINLRTGQSTPADAPDPAEVAA
jgi:hypothetical protein